MLGLGVGEIVGSLIFGMIIDKCKFKVAILLNILALAIGYVVLIGYTVQYEFSFVGACALTFTYGVQDAGVNTFLSSYLGF